MAGFALSALYLLIVIALVVLVILAAQWALQKLGVPIPQNILNVIYVIAVLIVIYLVVQWLLGGGLHLPSPA